MPGSGDSCYICTVPDSVGRVPAAAAGDPAAAGYLGADSDSTVAAADPYAAAASWIYAACSDSYWGSTATASALAWSAYHHFHDSSVTT